MVCGVRRVGGGRGATALIAGLVVGSVALVGFGADSIVDGSASAVLVWRFRAERAGRSMPTSSSAAQPESSVESWF